MLVLESQEGAKDKLAMEFTHLFGRAEGRTFLVAPSLRTLATAAWPLRRAKSAGVRPLKSGNPSTMPCSRSSRTICQCRYDIFLV